MRGSCCWVNRVKAEQVVSLESGARFGSLNRGNSSIREDPGTESAGGLRYITQVWIKGKFRPVSSGQGLMETASKGRSVR